MSARSVRWARAALMAAVCAALFYVDFDYEARFFGIVVEASLAHLHTGFLLAVALLTRDRLPLRACMLANLAAWEAKALNDDPSVETLVYGIVAVAATYVLLRTAARLIAGARHAEAPRFAPANLGAFVLYGAFGLPLAFVALAALLEGLVRGVPPSTPGYANVLVQVFFAKHFGIAIMTLPIVVLASQPHGDEARGAWWRDALPWRLLLLGVGVPVAALGLIHDRPFVLPPALSALSDYRLLVTAALLWVALRVDLRWSMPLLVMVLLLFTAAMTVEAAATVHLPGLIDLLRIASEVGILELLVLLLVLTDRDRARSLALREHASRHEPMTGLPNLTALRERALGADALEAVGFLLLDRADRLSAALGLRAETALLRSVTHRLRDIVDVYHLGAGQLLLTAQRGAAPAAPWTDVLARMHAFEFEWQGRRVRVLPYLGVAARAAGEPLDEAILRASSAAFDACQRSDTTVVFDGRDVEPTRPASARSALHLTSHVLARLRADDVELYFQPIVRLGGEPGTDVSGELLCRVRDADGALLSPAVFMPELQAIGRMVELDLAVLRRLCGWLREHRGALPAFGHLSINIGGQSLASRGFARQMLDVLDAFPLPLHQVCFEVTETAAITHVGAAASIFAHWRERGCGIALDDFGVGFQSFERLKQIPLTAIKIDGSFVHGMRASPRDRAIVRAAVDIARVFDAETIAEFVEDARTVDALHALGVDWGQGYHFGRPATLQAALLGVPAG